MIATHHPTREALDWRSLGSATSGRARAVRRTLLGADVAGLMAAFAIATLIGSSGRDLAREAILLAVLAPIWMVIAAGNGLYRNDGELAHRATSDDLGAILQTSSTATCVAVASVLVTGSRPPPGGAMTLWAASIGCVAAARALGRAGLRRRPVFAQNIVILGAGDVGQAVARRVLRHPEYGLRVVGFVDDEKRSVTPGLEQVRFLGGHDDLASIVTAHTVERVIVADGVDDGRVVDVLRPLAARGVTVDVVPRLHEIVPARVTVGALEGLTVIGLPPIRPSRAGLAAKRAIDIGVSSVLLVVLAPIMAFAAWRVRRDSPGGVLFRQTRIGRDQREFAALKFRTMRVGTDTSVHEAYIRRSMDPGIAPVAGGLYKLDQDAAVTRSGRWLRRTSLDELPQLINVLRGDMSLVGPRPCIPYETAGFEPRHFDRFLVPAGITGLWQVTARAQATFGEALDLDVAYARGRTLGLDLRLLCRTPRQVLAQRGAA